MSMKNGTIAMMDKLGLPVFNSVILPFITTNPYLQASVLSAYGLFGIYLQYNQDKLNDFIKIIQENPENFTKNIVETDAFKDGFIIILEEYLKERNTEKRKSIKNIFLGFTKLSEEEKKKFKLERLLDINSKILPEEVIYLNFLNGVIKPLQNIKIMENGGKDNSWNDNGELKLKYPITLFEEKHLVSNVETIDKHSREVIVNGLTSIGLLFPINNRLLTVDTVDIKTEYDITNIGIEYINYLIK